MFQLVLFLHVFNLHAGVRSLEVDLEKQKVVVVGDDITPFEVLSSISKVKFAESWRGPC